MNCRDRACRGWLPFLTPAFCAKARGLASMTVRPPRRFFKNRAVVALVLPSTDAT